MSSSSSEIESRHRKELKALEGEKRAALKKAKGTKGKKAKDAVSSIEEEYAKKLEELQAKHKEELTAAVGSDDVPVAVAENAATTEVEPLPAATDETNEPTIDPAQAARERKQAKARRKREKQRQEQLELEAEQERDLNDPNSARKQELAILKSKLEPFQLTIKEVQSDGHCLYRAVAAQIQNGDFMDVRKLCAKTLEEHEDDFSPFCEFDEGVTSYAQYVDRVRNSADWGGHVELRALSLALKRTIYVYSTMHLEPVHLGEEYTDDEPIRLSYHLHYYSLGEHYNQVVKTSGDEDDDEP